LEILYHDEMLLNCSVKDYYMTVLLLAWRTNKWETSVWLCTRVYILGCCVHELDRVVLAN